LSLKREATERHIRCNGARLFPPFLGGHGILACMLSEEYTISNIFICICMHLCAYTGCFQDAADISRHGLQHNVICYRPSVVFVKN